MAEGRDIPGEALRRTDVLATGESIARMQDRSGAIAWPDGHVDAWDHVECAMALSACGLREPARRAYRWLRETQRADGSWPRSTVAGLVTDRDGRLLAFAIMADQIPDAAALTLAAAGIDSAAAALAACGCQ